MTPHATRIAVRVVPGARRPGIAGRHGAAWKVRVAAPPERGRANRALVELLARRLGVPAADVAVVAGGASRDKTVEIIGVTAADAERLLDAREEES